MMSCLIRVPSQNKISHGYSTFKICVYVNVYHPTLPLEDANCTVIVSELVKKLSCLLLNPKISLLCLWDPPATDVVGGDEWSA